MEVNSQSFSPLQTLLHDEFRRRKEKNTQYSLRSFARHLSLSPGFLSMLMNGKRTLSNEKLHLVAQKLALSPQELQALMLEGLTPAKAPASQRLAQEQFELIAHWHHYAILSLARVRGQKATPAWIAERLGISELEARQALARLIHLNMLKIQQGQLIEVTGSTTTSDDIPSGAIKRFHEGVLQRAQRSLYETEVQQREFGSQVVSIKKRQLPLIKAWLRDMQDEFAQEFEAQSGDEVYAFSLQFFPLSQERMQ